MLGARLTSLLLSLSSSHAFQVQPIVVRSHACANVAMVASPDKDVRDALRRDQDRAVAARGVKERECLQKGVNLVAVQQRAVPKGRGGMGAAKIPPSKKKGNAKTKAKATKAKSPASTRQSVLAKEMSTHGVIRIDSALSEETADALRQFVDEELSRAEQEVEAGTHDADSRFADLVLVSKRCDLLLPLRGAAITALQELLGEGSTLGPLVEEIMGEHGVLQEIACLISYPGSEQQPLHPDTPYSSPPSLYASFIALQDVDEDMGPTVYLPGTHTKAAHSEFYGGDLVAAAETSGIRTAPVAEDFLRTRPVALGLLKKGDLACYNQQVLHCGSANRSDRIRRQFYISFRNPAVKVKARASMRPAFRNQLTIGKIRKELAAMYGPGGDGVGTGLFSGLDVKDQAHSEPGSTFATPTSKPVTSAQLI